MKTKLFAVALSSALLTSVVQPATAQDMSTNYYSSGWVNPYNNTMTQIYQSNMNMIFQQSLQNSQLLTSQIINRNLSRNASRRAKRLQAIAPRERAVAARFAKYQGTMYRETAPVMPSKLAAAFAKSTGKPEDRVAFAKLFQIFLNVYKQRAREQTAPATDVARTLALCIAANHFYRSGTMPTETQIAALRGTIRTALSESAQFRALSNAQKQQMNETVVILSFLVGYGIEEIAPKAPTAQRAQVVAGFRALASLNLKGLLGVDPKRLTFVPSGLVIKDA